MIGVGFLNVYKPLGISAHDCVAQVRKKCQTKRVGHSGTLDPMATGVLPIAVNQATRLLQFLPGGKAYQATVRFGMVTTTDDREGELRQNSPCPDLTLDRVLAKLPQFMGTIHQRPPAYSAIQVKGKRLYELARSGQEFTVEIPMRTVEVANIAVLGWQPGNYPEVILEISCGTGTYIRSIARDLGEALGCGAMLAALERTASNGFSLDHSITTEEITSRDLLPADRPLQHLTAHFFPEDLAKRWQQGQKIPTANDFVTYMRIYNEITQNFLGIGKQEGGLIIPVVVLKDSEINNVSPDRG